MWQFVDVKPTKSEQIRVRVEPLIKLAIDKQAEIERLDPPDIVRKALWDYLVKTQSPFVITTNGPQVERC